MAVARPNMARTNANTARTNGPNAATFHRQQAIDRTRNWRNRAAANRAISRAARQDAREFRARTAARTAATAAALAVATTHPRQMHAGGPRQTGVAFAARQHAHAQWYGNWRRHRRAFGWFGPVYWPYAYDTVFADVFWPGYASYYDDAYDPFWDYGYDDIYAGLFSPYGYDDLVASAAPPATRGSTATRGTAPPQTSDTTSSIQQLAPLCGDDSRDVAGVPIDQIQAAVEPNEEQRAALDALGDASVKAAQIVKDACPKSVALTPVGRLDAMQQRIGGMLEAVATVKEPLNKFYDLLTDEQKARFNALGAKQDRQSEAANTVALARSCSGASKATEWPAERIESMVNPTREQAEKLDAVRQATEQAADLLRTSCPTEMPATPPARLDAIQKRLETMRDAVATVQKPLAAFYDSLSDEQKGQFNLIGQAQNG